MTKTSLVKIKKHEDDRGIIVIYQNGVNLEFDLRRAYLIRDVPIGKERGHHAHRTLKQLLIALTGSVSIDVSDKTGSQTYHLVSPDDGLYIYGPTWRVLRNFSSDCVLLVFASDLFDPDDYIDDHDVFIKELQND